MRRDGSRHLLFVQRIPRDVRSQIVGRTLAIPLGDSFVFVTPSESAQAVRFSLRTSDPSEAKRRHAAAAAFLESVWDAYRTDAPIRLTHRQATALAGELYRVWSDSESRARSVAMVHTPGVGWAAEIESQDEQEAHWAAVVEMWEKVGKNGDSQQLEKPLGPIVDRLLLNKGIRGVDRGSRAMLLIAFWMALRDAFMSRQRNAGGTMRPTPGPLASRSGRRRKVRQRRCRSEEPPRIPSAVLSRIGGRRPSRQVASRAPMRAIVIR